MTRLRLQHEFHAHTTIRTTKLFKGTRTCEHRAVAKCISHCVILPIFETWMPSSCNIYRRSYSYVCTSNTSGTFGTRECRFGHSNLLSLRRAVLIIINHNSGRTWCDPVDGPAIKIKDCSKCWSRTATSTSAESSDKRASFRVTYSGLPVLRPGNSAYEVISQKWCGHKSNGHDITYSWSNDLTDRHAANEVSAEKARKRITVSDSALSARASAIWATMKAKIKIGMKPKKKTSRKKATKKRIFSTAEQGGALSFLLILGALGSLIGAASVAKAINDSKATRCQLEELQRWNSAADYISLRTNTDADCISLRTNADRA